MGSKSPISRRLLLQLLSAGVLTPSLSGWLPRLAADVAKNPQRKRACILLWMNGGPSQTDTFDLKPGHRNGGPFREIRTSTPGLRISEHFPRLARWSESLAIVRSMSTKEGDHGRATHLLRTGYLPIGGIQYPTLGSLVAHELGAEDSPLPNFVSVAPYRLFNPAAYNSGFLGPQYSPLVVGETQPVAAQAGQQPKYEDSLKVQDIALPAGVSAAQADARVDLLREMDQAFAHTHPGSPPLSHVAAYDRAVRLIRSDASKAFNLEEEPEALREAYGKNLFGQGCLLARRLVERGVPFVEVTLGNFNGTTFGWDTHQNNFDAVKNLSTILDNAWSTLMRDLHDHGLLESTTIVWMGEFGRTPAINEANGRDHFPAAWTTVMAGGGVRGGQAYGKTSPSGLEVEEHAVTVPDFLATVCQALGINPNRQNESGTGRPIRLVQTGAKPIKEVIA
jgi:uncharacterized protein (DUF1501 family)